MQFLGRFKQGEMRLNAHRGVQRRRVRDRGDAAWCLNWACPALQAIHRGAAELGHRLL